MGTEGEESPGDTQVPAEVTREAGEREDAGPRHGNTDADTHTPPHGARAEAGLGLRE